MAESALEHAQAAGDARARRRPHRRADAAGLDERPGRHGACAGSSGSPTRTCSRVHPPLAVHGALLYALAGRPDRGGAVGGCGARHDRRRATAPRRELDGRLARVPPGLPLPRRHRGHGRGRSGVVRRAQPRPAPSARACASWRAWPSGWRAAPTKPTPCSRTPLDVAMAFEFDPQTALTLVERGGIAADSGDWTTAARTADEAHGARGRRHLRRVLEQCGRVRVGGSGGGASRRRAGGRGPVGAGHATPAAPHLRAPGDVRAHPGRDGPGLRRHR